MLSAYPACFFKEENGYSVVFPDLNYLATCGQTLDEALVMVSLDISGRPYLSYDVEFFTERTGNFEACLLEEFLRGFAFAAGITLHVKKIDGRNTHHIIEAMFKAFGRVMAEACAIDSAYRDEIPSTKGVLK